MEGLNLKVSRLKIFNKDKLRGFADLLINECFVVRGFRIIEGQNGLFVSMPSKGTGEGKFEDIFFPITRDAREDLQKLILDEYEKVKQQKDISIEEPLQEKSNEALGNPPF
ncbi:MAG: SpoVG family protein [Candidatus Hydrogenedentota bacterium]